MNNPLYLEPISLKRTPSPYPLTLNGPPSHREIPISNKANDIADYIFSCHKGRLLIATTIKYACVNENGVLLWDKEFPSRFSTVAQPFPKCSRVFIYICPEMYILKTKTGEVVANVSEIIPTDIPPLTRQNEVLVFVKKLHSIAVRCLDLTLKQKWEYEIGQCESAQLLDFDGETVVVFNNKAILLDSDGKHKLDLISLPGRISRVFKASQETLLIQQSRNFNFVDVKTGQFLHLSNDRPIRRDACPLNQPRFVSALDSKILPNTIKVYPIAIFDLQGKCIKEIDTEFYVNDNLVDAEDKIIIHAGPTGKTYDFWEGRNHNISTDLYNFLKDRLFIFDANGNQLAEHVFEGRFCSPFTITHQGGLAYVSNGHLHLLKI